MNNPGSLTVSAHDDREIVMMRLFDAPCEIDLKAGGAYRYLWRKDAKATEMGARGVYREIAPAERLVYTESFDDPWYPGESLITVVLVEQGGKTTLTTTLRYESREARDAVLKSAMESGVAESYDKMAELLTSLGGAGTES
jgi:uncharacterized protein YndB with AHSA1/START domain